jgi:hypothetical protein
MNQNTTPITVTWNVNAYVKNKKSILKRIKNHVRPDEQDQQYGNYFNNYYNNQVEQAESGYKHILKNGMFQFRLTKLLP